MGRAMRLARRMVAPLVMALSLNSAALRAAPSSPSASSGPSATSASSAPSTWAPPPPAGPTLRLLGPATAPLVRVRTDMNIEVEHLASDDAAVSDTIARVDAARRAVGAALRDNLLVRVRVVRAPDKAAFLKLVGAWAEHSAAVAMPGLGLMIINGDAYRQGGFDQANITLIHEMSHLHLGARTRRPPPRWLDEGIARAVAGEGAPGDASALLVARWLGRLIPLEEIEREFPAGADRQLLAYRQGHSLARFVASENGGGDIASLVAALAGNAGPALTARLTDPTERAALEARWRASLSGGGSWTALFLNDGLYWGIAAALTLAAWFAIRRRNARLRRGWDEDERVLASLDDDAPPFDPDADSPEYVDEYEDPDYEPWKDGGKKQS